MSVVNPRAHSRNGGGGLEHAHGRRGDIRDLLQIAVAAMKAKKYDEAWQAAQAALSQDMDSAPALYICGQLALELDYQGLAANCFRRACALRPDQYNHWLGFGASLLDMRAFDEAEECFRKAMKITPEEPIAYANMSALTLNKGDPRECLKWANKAIDMMPETTRQKVSTMGNRGFAHLMLGEWEKGFDDYRHSMLNKGRVRRIYREPEEPQWDGQEGHVVVIQGEQGLGDEISFSSLIPELAAMSKKVIFDCHPKLVNTFKRSFPNVDCYGTRKESSVKWCHDYAIDSSAPISCVGHAFRKKDADFPRKAWIKTDPEKREKWREWLNALPAGRNIGIAWTGGIFLTNRKGRSCTLDQFDEIIKPGANYICLEYRDFPNDVKTWNEQNPDRKIHVPPVDANDYDDTLALLEELDLVVSVTTTIIHACGAIGKRCLCIVPSMLTSSQWRYGIEGDEMLWYPPGSVTLLRQHRSEDDLKMVIRRAAKAMQEYLQGLR